MSNLIRKFTIQHMHKSHKQRVNKLNKMQTLKNSVSLFPRSTEINEESKVPHASINVNRKKEKNVVTDNIVTVLLSMGYNLEQIMKGFKIYKFQSEEQALTIMTKDSELNKYVHRFLKNEDENQTMNCVLCGETEEEHHSTEFQRKEEVKGKKKKKENNEKLLIKENSRSSLPLIKEIAFDQDTIDFFSNKDLCNICCQRNVDEKDHMMKFPCGCKFCKECVIKYLKMKIKNGDVSIILSRFLGYHAWE